MFRRLLGGGGRAAEDATARGAAAGDGEDPLDLEAALAGLGGNQVQPSPPRFLLAVPTPVTAVVC
jgi:hypothetical protein|eukprot:COSAG01_NODE_2849_length_6977_cov_66.208200_2_plen_65_part_00